MLTLFFLCRKGADMLVQWSQSGCVFHIFCNLGVTEKSRKNSRIMI